MRNAHLDRSLFLRWHRMGDFLDVVYQGEQFPSCIDFGLAAKDKARRPFVLEVGEHRLNRSLVNPGSAFISEKRQCIVSLDDGIWAVFIKQGIALCSFYDAD